MTDPMWLKDFDLPSAAVAAALRDLPRLQLWETLDGDATRAYLPAAAAPGPGWTGLRLLQAIDGASEGLEAAFHYVVETDVEPQHEADLNAWYEREHLPGLAAVPGAIRAVRWRRENGSPCYLAGYDLSSPSTLERPEWLAVRHTAWSSQVRPLFRNPRRTMFRWAVTLG